MEKLAHALGWARSTVYEYADVGKTWPKQAEFQKLAAHTDKFGRALSWSHFILAATSPRRYHQLIEACLKHGWTVRELKVCLRPDQPPAKPTAAEPAPPAVADRR